MQIVQLHCQQQIDCHSFLEPVKKLSLVRMKVLEKNQNLLVKLGLSSHRLTEPTNEFMKTIICYIMLCGIVGPMILCAAVSLYKSLDDFQGAIDAFYVLSAGIVCLGSYLSIGINMKKVKYLQVELQQIVDSGKIHIMFAS